MVHRIFFYCKVFVGRCQLCCGHHTMCCFVPVGGLSAVSTCNVLWCYMLVIRPYVLFCDHWRCGRDVKV